MSTLRIALANLRFPASPEESVTLAEEAIARASMERAAENTCFFATVNCASTGSPTTSAIIRPDGTLLSYQPYGKEGLLVADIDISEATGLLASRCKST